MGEMRLVHLDLKGAAPKVSYLKQIFPVLRKWGATGLLIEYEDMFPYHGELELLRAENYYQPDDLKDLLSSATDNGLEVMPLIQTFGHFEFVLKHDKFRYLREVEPYPNALCPSNLDSFDLIKKMIDQVMHFHTNIRFFHIGSDEVWHLGMCDRCTTRMASSSISKDQLFVHHVHQVASYIKKRYNIQPVMWDDMFRHFTLEALHESRMSEVVEPMIWQYEPNLEKRLPLDLFKRYGEVFETFWCASAFKGATGPSKMLTDISYHLENSKKWLQVVSKAAPYFKHFRGIALTGWQRYDHYAVLCELLPVALPSLAVNLRTLANGEFSQDLHKQVSEDLGLPPPALLELSLDGITPDLPSPSLSLLYPGSSILSSVLRAHALHLHLEHLTSDPWFLAGFNSYLVKHSFTNPYAIEHWLVPALKLSSMYTQVLESLKQAMSEVYSDDTVEEFIGEHVRPNVEKLQALIEQGQAQIKLGARTKDYVKA